MLTFVGDNCYKTTLKPHERTQVVAIPRQCPERARRCGLQVASGRLITADRVQAGFYQKRFYLQHGQKISHQPLLLVARTGQQAKSSKGVCQQILSQKDVTEAICSCRKLGRLRNKVKLTTF